MRNAQLQREPAGRFTVGGDRRRVRSRKSEIRHGASGLGEGQLAGGGVVIENFGVAAPLDGGFELAAGFFLTKMLVKQVTEKFFGQSAVGFSFERLLHLAVQRNIGESGFAENRFAGLNVRLSKRLALRRDDRVAFFDAKHSEENSSIDSRKECINLETQFIGEAMQVNAASVVGENFQEAGHAAGTGMRQHDGLRPRGHSGTKGASRGGIVLVSRLRKDAVDRIDQLEEVGTFAVARMRNVNFEVRVDMRGMAAENDDTVGEDDGFFDIVSNDENRARGNLVTEPELEELAAEGFRGEDVKRGERFVHEENFGLDDECAGDADTLLHATGKFLGVSGLETVEADGVNDAQGALAALDGRHAAGLERGFDVFENGEPGKEREALKDDGNVGRFVTDRMAVPVDGAGAGRR